MADPHGRRRQPGGHDVVEQPAYLAEVGALSEREVQRDPLEPAGARAAEPLGGTPQPPTGESVPPHDWRVLER